MSPFNGFRKRKEGTKAALSCRFFFPPVSFDSRLVRGAALTEEKLQKSSEEEEQ